MTREDFEHGGGNETGKPVAVDHEEDYWWLGALPGVGPTVLVRLAWSSWPGSAPPAPELGKIESWPASQTAQGTPFCSPRIDERGQQNTVLAPVAQEDGMLEPGPAHKNEVRRSSMNRRGKNEYRRQSDYKSCGPSHTTPTPATIRGVRSPARGAHTQGTAQPLGEHSRTLAQARAPSLIEASYI